MEIDLFKILIYFIVYSFLGWIMESVVRSVCEKKLINTGFLKGPFCPIYGIGANIMLLFLNELESKPVLLFFISIIVLTLWEYVVGVLLEKIFHTKYWDYSDQKFNFQGRICLVNSICWGILGVIFIKYIHPFIEDIINKTNSEILVYATSIIVIVFLVDMITTIINVKNIKSTLEKVDNLNKEIKEKLKELRSLKKEKDAEKSIATVNEQLQEMVEKLKKKRNRTILHLYKNVYRLKKAFPALNTKEITEVLDKKLEFRKKREKNRKKQIKDLK